MRVVNFHNLVSEPLDDFDHQLQRRHINGFVRTLKHLMERNTVLPLPRLMASLDEGDPAPKSLTITFDDGFSGVYDLAFPALQEAGIPATVFLLTEPGGAISETRLLHFEVLEIAFRLSRVKQLDASELGIGVIEITDTKQRAASMQRVKQVLKSVPASVCEAYQRTIVAHLGVSNDEIAAYGENSSRYRKLSADQVLSLQKAGWTIGGHTRTHRPLSSLTDAEVHEEIDGNFEDLRILFGLQNPPFAYPYGNRELVGNVAPEAVRKSGFSCAFTTARASWGPSNDRFSLGRFTDSDLLFSKLWEGHVA